MIFGLAYLLVTAAVVLGGVNKGIEKFSRVIMPILLVLIIIISVYSLTLHYEENGVVRTGLQGLKKYVIPDFSGMTLKDYATVLMDAMGQLFFSISVAMGIMVAYGSYVKKRCKPDEIYQPDRDFRYGCGYVSGYDDHSGGVCIFRHRGNGERPGADVCFSAESI